MLQARRNWEYYRVYSIITCNPIFTEQDCKDMFDVFEFFAKDDMFFKIKASEVIDALDEGGLDFSKNAFKLDLLEWLNEDSPAGASFDDMVACFTAGMIGEEYKVSDIRKQITHLLSQGIGHLRPTDIGEFCHEFNCEHIKPVLTSIFDYNKSDD